ncbi:hypothetical protein Leryth_012791 [Lithospermum erythrorhizon]|nr:hypothetical protein Leryth_012791 [Lithospermum erythrorhizon]
MGFKKRKLLLVQKDEKNEDEDHEKDLSPCPEICYEPCTGCMIEKDTLIYPALASPPPSSSSTNHASSILVVVACLLGFAFVVVSYLLIIRYRTSVRNSRRRGTVSVNGNSTREEFLDENHGPVVDHPIWLIRTVGLNQSVIDSISVISYKSGEGLVDGTDCSVCLSEFEDDESLRLLPKCSHAFHIHCIDTWLRAHKNCPLCRAPIVKGDGNALEVNPEESNSDGSRYGEDIEVGRVNDLEEDGGGVSEVLVEGESTISLPIEDESSGNEIRGKNSGYRHEKGKRVRVRSDLVEHRVMMVVDEEMEPVRRSVSMDSFSASLIHHEVNNMFQVKCEGSSRKNDEGPSDHHMAIERKQRSGSKNSSMYSRVMKSSSFGRSLQKVPSSMKRSFSCGGGALY